MIEQSVKMHFPQLPFSPHIPYIEIEQNKSQGNFSNSNIANDNETNKQCDANISFSLIKDPMHALGKKKTIIKLNENAQNFQYTFYQFFTTRKKFPKRYVVLIHNEICCALNLRRVNRDETRSIYLYFVNFAKYATNILFYIKQNKNAIMRRIPELQQIMN